MKFTTYSLKYFALLIIFHQPFYATINAQCEYAVAYKEVYDTIRTPNNSIVDETIVYKYDEIPFSDSDVILLRSRIDSNYHGELLSVKSNLYNCHSYAWNISEGGPQIWIGCSGDAEDIYWEDYSYYEVSNESNATKVSYPPVDTLGVGDHSAITTANSGRYISKWGSSALVLHRWDSVPTNYFHPRVYDSLKFYAPSNPSNTMYFENLTYNAATYLTGYNIVVRELTIDINNTVIVDSVGYFTFDPSNNIIIEKNFKATIGTTLKIK